MKIMFWNTYKNSCINPIVRTLIEENQVDIAFFAEYQDDISTLTDQLKMQSYTTIGCNKIKAIGKKEHVKPGVQADSYSIQIIDKKYVLCAVHLPSQMNQGNQTRRNIIIQRIQKDIRDTEGKVGTKYSIILGDFNEDPYEDGCLSAVNFHGLPCMQDALRITRTIEGQEFEMFYNPMWNLFGDFSSPPGTYYYAGSVPKSSYWHIFDQVMIRPCLKDSFINDSLKIVVKVGEESLLNLNGRPNKKYSDHLPIVFEIKED